MGDGMRIVKATPIATGYGIGVVQFLAHANPAPAADTTDVIDWETEWGRFVKAQEQACRELEALKQELVREAYRHRTSLFDAHMLLLEESELVPSVKNQLRVKGCGTEEAVTEVIEALANMFETLAQSYGERRTRGLSERSESRPDLPEGRGFVAAKELLPPHTATLDLTSTVGLLTEQGGATSHAAMLARARAYPRWPCRRRFGSTCRREIRSSSTARKAKSSFVPTARRGPWMPPSSKGFASARPLASTGPGTCRHHGRRVRRRRRQCHMRGRRGPGEQSGRGT